MSKLIYSAITSLDGYVADAEGGFEWAAPDAEVHAFVNELERPIGTYLYGRRMYDTMVYWETAVDHSPVSQEYAGIWQAADKVVYSRTLQAVTSARTRLEREFTAESVQRLKDSSATDLSIGGAELGAQALQAGLVDEIHLLLTPVIVGGGKPALPDGLQAQLTLLDEHHFTSGVVHLHYNVQS
ncbi:dihydrofolate reductase family protein [Kribbella sp. NBC_00709]|uniref:dihydrofolate reductase family protein n=1 Tax=Kribbella sp. NBC_00709 TaxID=2975972 RepID=UPI002E2A1A78|nr:dihydrofolate reductase family protein [Kribbella sp. NBC_00709]